MLRTLIVLQLALWIGPRVAAAFELRGFGPVFGLPNPYIPLLDSILGSRVDNLAFAGLFLALLIAGAGVCAFSGAARTFYVVVNAVAMVAALVHGLLVRRGPVDFFYSANLLLVGVIFILLYCSPLKDQYGTAHVTAGSATLIGGPLPPPQPSDAAEPRASRPDVAGKRVRYCGSCGAANPGTRFCLQCGKPIV